MSFGMGRVTYSSSFFISHLAASGMLIATVLSTARSLFFVSSRCCISSSLLSPTAWANSQPVLKIQRWWPTSFILIIALIMESATLTGLVSTKPGSFLRSIWANCEATPRKTSIWELVDIGSSVPAKVRLILWPCSSKYVQSQLSDATTGHMAISPWRVDPHRSGMLDEGGLADWKGVVGSGWWAESTRSVG